MYKTLLALLLAFSCVSCVSAHFQAIGGGEMMLGGRIGAWAKPLPYDYECQYHTIRNCLLTLYDDITTYKNNITDFDIKLGVAATNEVSTLSYTYFRYSNNRSLRIINNSTGTMSTWYMSLTGASSTVVISNDLGVLRQVRVNSIDSGQSFSVDDTAKTTSRNYIYGITAPVMIGNADTDTIIGKVEFTVFGNKIVDVIPVVKNGAAIYWDRLTNRPIEIPEGGILIEGPKVV